MIFGIHDPEASTCGDQCRSDRSSGAKAIRHQVTTPPAALAAGASADHIQGGCSDVRTTSMPTYLSHRIITRDSARTQCSTLSEPFVRTDFARRVFRFSAPHTWNALPKSVRDSDSLGSFKSRLKTFLFAVRATDSDMTCREHL